MGARFSKIALLACAAALAAPTAALASASDVDLTTGSQTLVVTARGSERNIVTVTTNSAAAPSALVVTDAGAGVATNDPLCSMPNALTVSCPIAAVSRVDINAGNLDDSAVLAPQVPASIRATPDGGSGNDSLIGGSGNDTIIGGTGSDTLLGGAGADTMTGGSSPDLLSGQDGPDSLSGEDGDDLLDGGGGSDSMRGGSNDDTVTYGSRTAGVAATIGGFPGTDGNAEDGPPGRADTIDFDVEAIIGGSGTDLLGGDADPNQLFGGEGDDAVLGGGGADLLFGQGGRDLVSGEEGNDLVKGGTGRDRMLGGFGADLLKARDGTRETRINCGGGRHDRLKRDRRDPHGKSC